MKIKKYIITVLVLFVFASISFAGGVEQYDSIWGYNCGSKDSLAVKIINGTNKTIDCRVCLERTDGSWGCFLDSNVRPNELVGGGGWAYFVCHSTGEVKWYWKDAGDYRTKLGHPDRD